MKHNKYYFIFIFYRNKAFESSQIKEKHSYFYRPTRLHKIKIKLVCHFLLYTLLKKIIIKIITKILTWYSLHKNTHSNKVKQYNSELYASRDWSHTIMSIFFRQTMEAEVHKTWCLKLQLWFTSFVSSF